tara:strand:+ start:337 stop:486 length:150 start_codon:yes stop_codon:yes gene_type:complete
MPRDLEYGERMRKTAFTAALIDAAVFAARSRALLGGLLLLSLSGDRRAR